MVQIEFLPVDIVPQNDLSLALVPQSWNLNESKNVIIKRKK